MEMKIGSSLSSICDLNIQQIQYSLAQPGRLHTHEGRVVTGFRKVGRHFQCQIEGTWVTVEERSNLRMDPAGHTHTCPEGHTWICDDTPGDGSDTDCRWFENVRCPDHMHLLDGKSPYQISFHPVAFAMIYPPIGKDKNEEIG